MNIRCLWLGLALGLILTAASQAATPSAVLMEMSGRCEVAPGGAPFRPARPGLGLSNGDRVAVRDGEAKLLRSDGRVETIGAGRTVRIEPVRRGGPARGGLGRLWEILSDRVGTALGE